MTDSELRAAVARLLADRERQGFPARCSDPSVLATIAAALGETAPTPRKSTRLREETGGGAASKANTSRTFDVSAAP